MDRPLVLAYSPCPNDTYIFAALTKGLLEGAPAVRALLEDVETLNEAASRGAYELTKVSYGAIPMLMGNYRILRSGGALGRGCGPLLVARPQARTSLLDFKDANIAIPGERTTAFMLLRLAVGGRPRASPMRFDTIVEAVASGTVDAGLIIHESRFTYREAGLVAVADLGEWWEAETKMPIPLGAVLIRSDAAGELGGVMDDAIRRSLRFARERTAEIIGYVREHAFEMNDEVMRKHINLYVNEYTSDVGESGIAAVNELFRRAHDAGIIPKATEANFVQ